MKKEIIEFLKQSNYIEREYSPIALKDAKIAWNYAFNNRNKINIAYILKIHELLMKNIKPDIAGRIRTCDVWIGGKLRPWNDEIESNLLMKVCFEMIMYPIDSKEELEKKCKEIHIDFKNIHPFEDGNGRVGRILWQIHRLKLGLPIHIIHEGDEQINYYSWFDEK